MTDETARLVIDGDWSIICEAIDSPDKVADLQQMARLWLLLPEIREALDAEAVSATYIPLFDKITAIAGGTNDKS